MRTCTICLFSFVLREVRWAGLAGKAFSAGAAGRVPWREQRRGSRVSSWIPIDKERLVGTAEAGWVRGPAGARVQGV